MTRQEIESLFKMHYVRMYRLALSILLDEDESKDAVQEVFARLISRNVVLMPDTAESYLMQSVRNVCLNLLEQRRVREQHRQQVDFDGYQVQGTEEERLQMEELMDYVEQHLPPLSQEIFRLRYLGGLTCQEVADKTGVSRMTVNTHLRQAIERIKAFFHS